MISCERQCSCVWFKSPSCCSVEHLPFFSPCASLEAGQPSESAGKTTIAAAASLLSFTQFVIYITPFFFTFCSVVSNGEISPRLFRLASYLSDCAKRSAWDSVSLPNIQLLLLQEIQPSISVPEVIFPTCQPTSFPHPNRQRPSCFLQKAVAADTRQLRSKKLKEC